MKLSALPILAAVAVVLPAALAVDVSTLPSCAVRIHTRDYCPHITNTLAV